MANDPRRVSELLTEGALAGLAREAERRREATETLKRLLPLEEASHVVSAVSNAAGELVLVMDTPSWAARIRYRVGDLPYREIKIRVAPRGG